MADFPRSQGRGLGIRIKQLRFGKPRYLIKEFRRKSCSGSRKYTTAVRQLEYHPPQLPSESTLLYFKTPHLAQDGRLLKIKAAPIFARPRRADGPSRAGGISLRRKSLFSAFFPKGFENRSPSVAIFKTRCTFLTEKRGFAARKW